MPRPRRKKLSFLHKGAFLLGALLSVGVLGTSLGLLCGQLTYDPDFESALYAGASARTAQWAINHTEILSNADQIAIVAWSGVAALYYLTVVGLLFAGQYALPVLRSGVDIAILFFVGLSGCAIFAWTMAYKWQTYWYCHRSFTLDALALCNLGIAAIILGWILSGYSFIVGLAEAFFVMSHGPSALRSSFHDIESPRRTFSDFSRIGGAIEQDSPTPPRPNSPRQAKSAAAVRSSTEKAAGGRHSTEQTSGVRYSSDKGSGVRYSNEKGASSSATGSDVSLTLQGRDSSDYQGVNRLPWGAQNAVRSDTEPGVEVLRSSLPRSNAMLFNPPRSAAPPPVPPLPRSAAVPPPRRAAGGTSTRSAGITSVRAAEMAAFRATAVSPEVLDAERSARPSRVPVDRRYGYIPDGQGGRGARGPPTRFVTDHYTRPVTPPTRRASHQRSLSQANELRPPSLAAQFPPLSHSRSKSWDYI